MNKWFIILIIFVFSMGLRIWNINQMGRTWDEAEYVEPGYRFIELIKKGDLNNDYFFTTYNHPPLAKYLYGITAHLDTEKVLPNGNPVLRYDLTYSRMLSAITSSLAIIVVVIIGWQFGTLFVGVISGLILSMLPVFLGYSQLVTTESMVMLFFTLPVYIFFLLLQKYSLNKLLATGVLTGLALQIKQSNFMLVPLFIIMYFIWYFKAKHSRTKFINSRAASIIYIVLISIVVFVLLWPMLPFHAFEVFHIHQKLWNVKFTPKIWLITLSPPEVFFGRLMLTPIFYYIVYLFITTPFLLLLFFFKGILIVFRKRDWSYYILLAWFLVPFILSVYSWRQHGVRYIIQIYAPLSILAAVGFDFIVSKFTKRDVFKFIYFLPVVIYLFIILFKITPYYLDYFNLLVGGTSGVYTNRSFQIGWWGQGIREAGLYLEKSAPKRSKIGLALSPIHVMPPLINLDVSKYSEEEKYDFVIVNYYNVLRERFNDYEIKKNYNPMYFVKADGASLVTVYKHK